MTKKAKKSTPKKTTKAKAKLKKVKAKTVKTPKKKAAKLARWPMLNVKVTPTTLRAIQGRAGKYAKKNLSAWVRHASLNFKPRRQETIPQQIR